MSPSLFIISFYRLAGRSRAAMYSVQSFGLDPQSSLSGDAEEPEETKKG